MGLTTTELRTIALSAEVKANDYEFGRQVLPNGIADMWHTIADLARECANLSERMEVQESRKAVGRPKVNSDAV